MIVLFMANNITKLSPSLHCERIIIIQVILISSASNTEENSGGRQEEEEEENIIWLALGVSVGADQSAGRPLVLANAGNCYMRAPPQVDQRSWPRSISLLVLTGVDVNDTTTNKWLENRKTMERK